MGWYEYLYSVTHTIPLFRGPVGTNRSKPGADWACRANSVNIETCLPYLLILVKDDLYRQCSAAGHQLPLSHHPQGTAISYRLHLMDYIPYPTLMLFANIIGALYLPATTYVSKKFPKKIFKGCMYELKRTYHEIRSLSISWAPSPG